jgi:hypothetical protein
VTSCPVEITPTSVADGLNVVVLCPCGERALRHLFFAGDGNPSVSNSTKREHWLALLR